MTEIERKALALVNEVFRERGHGEWTKCTREIESLTEALCRAIEQHEQFKREVSDAAVEYNEHGSPMAWTGFDRFILPKPKPDPLVAVMDDFMSMDGGRLEECVEQFRVALARRGLEVREIEG